jgi:putative phage-type endonuclease
MSTKIKLRLKSKFVAEQSAIVIDHSNTHLPKIETMMIKSEEFVCVPEIHTPTNSIFQTEATQIQPEICATIDDPAEKSTPSSLNETLTPISLDEKSVPIPLDGILAPSSLDEKLVPISLDGILAPISLDEINPSQKIGDETPVLPFTNSQMEGIVNGLLPVVDAINEQHEEDTLLCISKDSKPSSDSPSLICKSDAPRDQNTDPSHSETIELTEVLPKFTDIVDAQHTSDICIEATDKISLPPEIEPIVQTIHNDADLAKEAFLDKIKKFQAMPCYKQKSKQWLDQRNNYLTASTIAAAIGVMGKVAKHNLLLNKVSYGTFNSFNGNTATHWGNKYEPVANGVYSYRKNVKIYSFGMITNDKYPILGISPDGITETTMLEIKCPWSRVIDGKIKTEYYHQMQEQMAICEFDKCDFLECRFEEISESCFWDDFYYYNEKENINHEKGIILSYINLSEADIEYIYSPIEYYQDIDKMREWKRQTIDQLMRNDNTIYLNDSYWYLIKYNCQVVKRDPYWIIEYYPVLQKFWEEVEYYRKNGIDTLLEKTNKKNESASETETPKITNYFNESNSVSQQPKKKSRCLL